MKFVHTLLAAPFLAMGTVSLSAAPLFCTGGPGMLINTQVPDHFEITFKRAKKGADELPPLPGQCAMAEVPLPEGSATVISITKTTKRAFELLAAAKGGTFQVDVTGKNDKLVVNEIVELAIDDGGGDDQVDAEADDQDEDDVAGGETCGRPGATATVVIPKKEGNKLNVRLEADSGSDIIGTVRNGKKVVLSGQCETEGNVGIVADKEGDEVWCRVTKPIEGCARAKYLRVRRILDDAVGFRKK